MRFGDIVQIDFGMPIGPETGYTRPAIIVVADAFLRYRPTTVFVVPLTSTPRLYPSHVAIEPDAGNGLDVPSVALVEQMRAIATERCGPATGNVRAVVGRQILETLAMITGWGRPVFARPDTARCRRSPAPDGRTGLACVKL